MVKAQFKTAHNQREIVVNGKVSSGAPTFKVGQVVTATANSDGTTTLAAVGDSVLTPLTTHYIVAQSDMTMAVRPYNEGDYADTVAMSTAAKKVALFAVIDVNDVTYKVVS